MPSVTAPTYNVLNINSLAIQPETAIWHRTWYKEGWQADSWPARFDRFFRCASRQRMPV